jgi:hyperosmotically inducible protein
MNPGRRSVLSAALAAIAAAGVSACGSIAQPETRRTTGEFTHDASLTARVKSAIATDAGARTAAAINIETFRGVVQLTGFVDSGEQSMRAEAAAKKVDGVRSVRNNVRVKAASS